MTTTTRRCDSCGQTLELASGEPIYRSIDRKWRAATSSADALERALIVAELKAAREYAAVGFHDAKNAGLTDEEIDPCGHVRMLIDDVDDLLAAEVRTQ